MAFGRIAPWRRRECTYHHASFKGNRRKLLFFNGLESINKLTHNVIHKICEELGVVSEHEKRRSIRLSQTFRYQLNQAKPHEGSILNRTALARCAPTRYILHPDN